MVEGEEEDKEGTDDGGGDAKGANGRTDRGERDMEGETEGDDVGLKVGEKDGWSEGEVEGEDEGGEDGGTVGDRVGEEDEEDEEGMGLVTSTCELLSTDIVLKSENENRQKRIMRKRKQENEKARKQELCQHCMSIV